MTRTSFLRVIKLLTWVACVLSFSRSSFSKHPFSVCRVTKFAINFYDVFGLENGEIIGEFSASGHFDWYGIMKT